MAGKTPDRDGKFKYDYSYEGIAKLMKTYVPAYAVEIEKFFQYVLFNYVIANGDAHLKNFSVSETSIGDHRLAPAYDLLNTRLHLPNDSDMALSLFDGDFQTGFYAANGFHGHEDFMQFGLRIGMKKSRVEHYLSQLQQRLNPSIQFIENSHLLPHLKEKFIHQLRDYVSLRMKG